MKYIVDIFTNHVFIATAIAWAISQTAKIFTNWIVTKKFDIKRLMGDGGMPSGHAATVAAVTFMCGYVEGFGSPLFALAIFFLMVVMRDAVGVRRETGKNARKICEMADKVNSSLPEEEKIDTSNLKKIGGHTLLEVLCGVAVGIIASIGYILIVF